jgi:RNA 2',3'-cyclic 3'-phosphodiesterase
VRCFIAIDLSREVRSALDLAQGRLRAHAPAADVRWVGPAGRHITLQFLGEVSDPRLAEVRNALATAATAVSPMALGCRGLGAFPELTRPRVVWAGIRGAVGELSRLAAACQRACAPLGFVPEKRPFRGHVTLARVRSPRGFGPLARVIESMADDDFGAWTAAEVVLYRSHLRSTGSVYEALDRVPLGRAVA